MKKLISLAAAVMMLISSVPSTVYAEDKTDLDDIAVQAGVKDYFFPHNSGAYRTNPDSFNINAGLNKNDYAMCVMTVLANRGVISASDILAGANNFSDLDVCDEVNSVIEQYANTAANGKLIMGLGGAYSNIEQGILSMLLMWGAESASKPITDRNETEGYMIVILKQEKNYFDYLYPMVVVGCADGEWSFGGKSYDKCILTLDPSIGNHFDEDRCIYMDSTSGELCVPCYDLTSENGNIFTITNKTDLLNFNGPINPTEDKTVLDEGENFQYIDLEMIDGMEYDLILDTGEDEPITAHGAYGAHPDDFTITPFLNKPDCYSTFCKKGDVVLNVDMTKEIHENEFFTAAFQNYSCNQMIYSNGKFTYKNSENRMSITKAPENFTTEGDSYIHERSTYIMTRENYLSAKENDTFILAGTTTGTVDLEFTADGVIVSDTDLFRSVVTDPLFEDYFCLTASEPVMLKMNEENIWYPYIKADDGTFSKSVERGDVNCDGVVDAADASLVLKAYAVSSTDDDLPTFIDDRYGDFNLDEVVDAADASDILRYYAEMSTQK